MAESVSWRIGTELEAEAVRAVLAKVDEALEVVMDAELRTYLHRQAVGMRTALLEWDRGR